MCSDGSTENSSSDSESNSNTRDSPSPTDFHLKNRENVTNVTEGELLYKKQQSFLSSQIDEQKTKSLAPNGRSSFLNAGAKSNLSSHKVKTINYMDEPTQTILSAANSKLSVLDKSSVPPDDDGSESNKTAGPGEKVVATSSPAAARLSFLKSTIGGARPGRMTAQEFVEDNDETELTGADGQTEHKADVCSNKSDGGLTGPAKVLLTRKSPSVAGSGSFASTSIVRGTQKPMITRKPAILKDKPKVPLKPNKLTLRSPSSSPSPSPSPTSKNSPVAAPRSVSVSFREPRENLNIDRTDRRDRAAPGDETKLEETSSITVMSLGKKESETVAGGKEQNNSLIISVSSAKTEHNDPDSCDSADSNKTDKLEVTNEKENSPPQVQKNLAIKNKEALEAIRKSLSNKLISTGPPKIVKESMAALEGPGVKSLGSKPEFNKTSSNSFEENRACIADALQFNRHDNVARPSTKRQAPRPPNDSEEMDEQFDVNENEEKSNEKNSVNGATTLDEATSNEVESFVEPKPALRNSSMKSEHSVKNRDSKARTVQFSPETVTVTLPPTASTGGGGGGGHKVLSYNNWMVKHQNHYLESSFTGQPITMYPPGVGPQMKKPGLAYSQPPIVDDGPRKWTEKKNKWRSKSTPRSSEIDEIIGSSKTKAQNKLAIFMPSTSPGPIRRQSRVEIYESEKKNLVQKKPGKFSLKKLFKIQGLPDGLDDSADVKFLDRDHEREILERQQSQKLRPEIIHPLDLLNSGVEVIKITPKVQGKSENLSSSKLGEISPAKIDADTKPGLATKFNSDCKDSGHDTASIQTETSEEATSISNEESSQVRFWFKRENWKCLLVAIGYWVHFSIVFIENMRENSHLADWCLRLVSYVELVL